MRQHSAVVALLYCGFARVAGDLQPDVMIPTDTHAIERDVWRLWRLCEARSSGNISHAHTHRLQCGLCALRARRVHAASKRQQSLALTSQHTRDRSAVSLYRFESHTQSGGSRPSLKFHTHISDGVCTPYDVKVAAVPFATRCVWVCVTLGARSMCECVAAWLSCGIHSSVLECGMFAFSMMAKYG